MGRLKGKVAFITGGARGQGRAIAEKFASEGADIMLVDSCTSLHHLTYPLATKDDLAEAVEAVEATGQRCLSAVADVREQEGLDAAAAETLDAFGRIDIMVANAGIVDFKPFWEITEEEWHDELEINCTGAWRTAKAVAPAMMQAQSGNMIFSSSMNGVEGGANFMHYIAAKHGVLGIMKGAALELAPHNIRCNAVVQGPVDTIMNNNQKGYDRVAGQPGGTRENYIRGVRNWVALRNATALPPEAIADGMIWLASEEAKYVTGHQLVIDAGHLILPGFNLAPVWDE
jgi:SDR family mycofactocin-dependent oxidoreductase